MAFVNCEKFTRSQSEQDQKIQALETELGQVKNTAETAAEAAKNGNNQQELTVTSPLKKEGDTLSLQYSEIFDVTDGKLNIKASALETVTNAFGNITLFKALKP